MTIDSDRTRGALLALEIKNYSITLILHIRMCGSGHQFNRIFWVDQTTDAHYGEEGNKMAEFEIGIAYRKGSRLFIAVDQATLISCKDGVATKVKPTTKYDFVRCISVEKICEHWNIEVETFDQLMSKHLVPSQVEIKTRPRGYRRKKGVEEEFWRIQRTARVLCSNT